MVKCLAQEHNTMSQARARPQTARSGVESINHEATGPATSLFPWQCYFEMSLNLVIRLYQRYDNVKINKNAMVELHRNSNT